MGSHYNYRHVSAELQDSGAGVTLTIPGGPGDFQRGATNKNNAEHIAILNSGVFDDHVVGDDMVQEWSITIHQKAEELTHASAARILDWIQQTGIYAPGGSTPVTSLSSHPDVWAFAVVVTYDDGQTSTTETLPWNLADQSMSVSKEGNKITLSGRNFKAPVRA